jgi:hypothetical protein
MLLLLACTTASDTTDAPALTWDRFSADVVEGYAEVDIPPGAVWTAECCRADVCGDLPTWRRVDGRTGVDCPSDSEWVEVTYVLPE